MRDRLPRWALIGGVLLCVAAGCGGRSKPVKVSGVLTWDDGKPVEGATVMFIPQFDKGRQASGFTGKDGSFDLTTFNAGDGAIPGEYKVVVTIASASPDTGMEMAKMDPTKAMLEWQKKQGDKGKSDGKKTIPAVYTTEKS